MWISDKDEAYSFLSPEIFHHLIPSGRGSQVFMVRRMKVATEVSDIENTCYPIQCLGQAAGRGVQDDDGCPRYGHQQKKIQRYRDDINHHLYVD